MQYSFAASTLVLLAVATTAVGQTETQRQPTNNTLRRCAFIGQWSSFTLVDSTGTAAYTLGPNKYIADIASSGEEPNWWLYRPVGNGDPNTTLWAFARRPRCGKYTVARFSNGVWQVYDRTDAWGDGLGESRRPTGSWGNGEVNNRVLFEKLRDIEDKLKSIQRDERPSLGDLEQLLSNPQQSKPVPNP